MSRPIKRKFPRGRFVYFAARKPGAVGSYARTMASACRKAGPRGWVYRYAADKDGEPAGVALCVWGPERDA